MADQGVKLFLSCVSDEFGAYRDALRRALTRPNVEVKIQEDFKALGGDTLRMLEDYIAAVRSGGAFRRRNGGLDAGAEQRRGPARAAARSRSANWRRRASAREALASLTYTQWEAWLAIAFDKDLLIVAPATGVERGPEFAPTDASRASQADHLKR